MSINTLFPTFRFTTLRNPKTQQNAPLDPEDVMPATTLINDIAAINESNDTSAQKLADVNQLLQDYIDGANFIPTKAAFFAIINTGTPTQNDLNKMYDNMIVRLLTKSNTNEVYGILIRYIRAFAADLNAVDAEDVQIIIPERITFAFTEFEGTNDNTLPVDNTQQIIGSIAKLNLAKKKLQEAKDKNVVTIDVGNKIIKRNLTYQALHMALKKSVITVTDAKALLDERLTSLDKKARADRSFPQSDEAMSGSSTLRGVETTNVQKTFNEIEYNAQLRGLLQKAIDLNLTSISDTETIIDQNLGSLLSDVGANTPMSLEAVEVRINDMIAAAYDQLDVLLPGNTYSLIAGSWHDVTQIVNGTNIFADESGATIVVYNQGCAIKYPLQVADLRIIEQQTVGYLPAEIAHINNTQRGEMNTRVTRRLKKVETSESFLSESEVFHETDTQSAEKFSMENEASQVQQEENSWNINATASYSLGPVSASVNGGYNSSSLQVSTNSSAQSYAKDVFTRIVDRVSNRIRTERSTKTIEEFEETVTHVIDNREQETKSYVYRWLNKLVRGTLKNYGKRLMLDLDIAHPAHYYLTRMIKEKKQLNIPADPRDFKVAGVAFNPAMIDRANYLSWAKQYNVQLESPPDDKIIVSETFTGASGSHNIGKLIPVKKGYQCKYAIVTNTYGIGWPGGHQIRIIVGNAATAHYDNTEDFWTPVTFWLNNERENLPVAVMQGAIGFIMTLEVHCHLTPEAFSEWQVKCYYDLLKGYDQMKTEAESQINQFDINAPGLPPEKKRELIRTELKKEAIRKMFRCNPFWMNDKFVVGKEYNPDCCKDGQNAERVRFLESVFDWQNMTYELHPYFYANKTQWDKLLDLTDDDPHFEGFLKASYATVRIPVHRDDKKEIAACNFLVNNAIGNYETIPEGLEELIDELALEPATEFTFDLDGNPISPSTSVDLGIFPIPTGLVILECGTENGVKPIGFPQTAEGPTDVSIPKQYSPAIIADSCIEP